MDIVRGGTHEIYCLCETSHKPDTALHKPHQMDIVYGGTHEISCLCETSHKPDTALPHQACGVGRSLFCI